MARLPRQSRAHSMQLPTPSTLMGGTGTMRELAMMLCSICVSLRKSAPKP